jgi:hypothetical protein
MSGRAKRVFVYAAALLTAAMPVMPFEKGTVGFALSLAACGLWVTVVGVYVLRGELGLRARGVLGNKLVAATLITLLFGASLFVGCVVYLLTSPLAWGG